MKPLRALIFAGLLVGCGTPMASSSRPMEGHLGDGGNGTPSFTAVRCPGSVTEVQANSTVVQNGVTLIETNFSQTDTSVSAAKGSVVVIGGTSSGSFIVTAGCRR